MFRHTGFFCIGLLAKPKEDMTNKFAKTASLGRVLRAIKRYHRRGVFHSYDKARLKEINQRKRRFPLCAMFEKELFSQYETVIYFGKYCYHGSQYF